jgi:voltage-gated potassium channel
MNSARGFLFVLLFLLGLFALGTLGFHYFEGYSYFESFYLTASTITTVGYGDLHPSSIPGRLLSIFLMLAGITAAASILGVSLNYFVEGGLWSFIGVRRMKRKIQEMENHFIVCGYGDVGKGIVDIFSSSDVPFLVIEQDGMLSERLQSEGISVVEGDATTEKTLQEAGIMRAAGLVTTLLDDTENVYIALSARGLNPKIRIVSRATSPKSSDKLYKIGVDTVISLSAIGAKRMAEALTNPEIVGFMEILTEKGKAPARLEVYQVRPGCIFEGKKVRDARSILGNELQLVAIKRDQSYLANPEDSTDILLNDDFILWGEERFFQKLDRIH